MINHLIAGTKRVFGLHRPGRNLKVYPDDVFIVSYPKSGNTWTRFLIANLLHPEEKVSFANIDRLVPESEELSRRALDRLEHPRIMKTHQYFDPRYKRVIYVVRDPRDVVVSQYHFFRKRRRIEDNYPLSQFVSRFVAGTACDYGSWGENVSSWTATRYNHPGFLLLRYEDMLTDTPKHLSRIASFIGIPASPDQIAEAVDHSAADKMRSLERSAAGVASVTRNARQEIPFVRAARVGQWENSLSRESLAELEGAWGPLMSWLGYAPAVIKDSEGEFAKFPETVFGDREL